MIINNQFLFNFHFSILLFYEKDIDSSLNLKYLLYSNCNFLFKYQIKNDWNFRVNEIR
jgi:hypothetical protein